MILEIAEIRIKPGQQAGFNEAIQRALSTVMSKVEGAVSHSVHKGVESPERYVLQIVWTSIEAHNVGFRESPAFAEWRAIIGPFFASPPVVEHFDLLVKS